MKHVMIGLASLALAACGGAAPVGAPDARETPVSVAKGVKPSPPPTTQQTETFGPLAALVGKRFEGAPTDNSSEDMADIQHWEWALGGSAILIRHALANGEYGGDTYVYKDAKTGDLVYVYITNAGFRTEGIMTVNADGSYTAEEAVDGHPTITKVRSTSRLNADGTSSMTSEYYDSETWTPGHAFTYRPTEKDLPQLKAPDPRPQPG